MKTPGIAELLQTAALTSLSGIILFQTQRQYLLADKLGSFLACCMFWFVAFASSWVVSHRSPERGFWGAMVSVALAFLELSAPV